MYHPHMIDDRRDLAIAPDAPLHQMHPVLRYAGQRVRDALVDFFTATLRNAHTRAAYTRALTVLFDWMDGRGLALNDLSPRHIAAWVESRHRTHGPATVRLQLAAVRRCLGWLHQHAALPDNPAAIVRAPRLVRLQGKTDVLGAHDVGRLLAHFGDTPIDQRDHALVATLAYTFLRISAALALRVRDLQGKPGARALLVHEKGGRENRIPLHPHAERALVTWLKTARAARNPDAWLFPALDHDGTPRDHPLQRQNAHARLRAHAVAAGLDTPVGCHTFRATGITTFLQNGGALDIAQVLAGHASPTTTKLYDRRQFRLGADMLQGLRYSARPPTRPR